MYVCMRHLVMGQASCVSEALVAVLAQEGRPMGRAELLPTDTDKQTDTVHYQPTR